MIPIWHPKVGSPYYPHKFAVNLTLLQIKIYVFFKGMKGDKIGKTKKDRRLLWDCWHNQGNKREYMGYSYIKICGKM